MLFLPVQITPTIGFHSLASEEFFITGETKHMGVSILWQDKQMNISFALKFASQANVYTTKFFYINISSGAKEIIAPYPASCPLLEVSALCSLVFWYSQNGFLISSFQKPSELWACYFSSISVLAPQVAIGVNVFLLNPSMLKCGHFLLKGSTSPTQSHGQHSDLTLSELYPYSVIWGSASLSELRVHKL